MALVHKPDAAAETTSAANQGRAAPGKRAPTDRLTARTGSPAVDEGTLCERTDTEAADCFLTEARRTRFLGEIRARAGVVGANARDALQDTRIEHLLEQPHGWGPLAEFLFYSTTGPLIGMVMAGVRVSKFARRADDIQATLVNVSRAQRKVLQGMAGVAPGRASKARFIELVRDSIGPWQIDLGERAVAELDDGGLTALKDALDPTVATVDYFKGRIDDMLTRFDAQQIDQAGVLGAGEYRLGELIWLTNGRRRRQLIMMEDHGVHHQPDVSGSIKPRDLVQKANASGKPIVIDKDLESMAVAFFTGRTGRDPFEMDAEAAIATGGALGKVASELVLDAITGFRGL
jgi:hypothetical protein